MPFLRISILTLWVALTLLAAMACDQPAAPLDTADTPPLTAPAPATKSTSASAFANTQEPSPTPAAPLLMPASAADLEPEPRTDATSESCGVLCDVEFWEIATVDDVRAVLVAGVDLAATDDFGEPPLIYAIAFADSTEIIRLLLEYGADPNQSNDYYSSVPMHLLASQAAYDFAPWADTTYSHDSEAYLSSTLDLMRLLLEYGADLTIRDHRGQSVLFIYIESAIESDAKVLHPRVVRLMLKNGVEIVKGGSSDQHLLTFALWAGGDPEVIQLLLAHGAYARSMDDGEFALLHTAIEHAAPPRTIEILLAHARNAMGAGAGLNDRTALHIAARVENLDPQVVAILLDGDGDATARDDEGQTPLHHAASFSNAAVVRILLDHGADAGARDHRMRTPLHIMSEDPAYRDGEVDPDVFGLLIRNGADVNARDDRNETPLHHAAWRDHPDNARLLLEHGAYVNARDRSGATPLHAASATGVPATVNLLLQHGANPNAVDDQRQTPLHWSADRLTNAEVTAVLLNSGSRVNAADEDGNTPLHTAAKAREHGPEPRSEILRMLLDAGAGLAIANRDGDTVCDLIEDDDAETLVLPCP